MSSFGEIGKGLVSSWLSLVYTPAFSFWVGGGAIVISSETDLGAAESWLNARSDVELVLLAVGALVVVGVSGEVVQRCDRWVIQALEGYWPRILKPLQRVLTYVRVKVFRIERDEKRWAELGAIEVRTAEQDDEYARLESRLRWTPPEPADRMPTAFGDALKAAELRSLQKYEIDSVLIWPRLWLLLPEAARAEVRDSRAALDADAGLFLWGAMFIVWGNWNWIAVPIGLLVCLFSYTSMIADARTYGDIVESVFDLYRMKIYEALRLPLPVTPADEREKGKQLTKYVLRGSDLDTVCFVNTNDGEEQSCR